MDPRDILQTLSSSWRSLTATRSCPSSIEPTPWRTACDLQHHHTYTTDKTLISALNRSFSSSCESTSLLASKFVSQCLSHQTATRLVILQPRRVHRQHLAGHHLGESIRLCQLPMGCTLVPAGLYGYASEAPTHRAYPPFADQV